MTSADEDEAGEEDVDDGVVGDEDQDSTSVCTEEDVILTDQHLNVKTTNPGEEAGVVGPDPPGHVPQYVEADDGEEGDVGVDFITIHFVSYNKCIFI